ncbi:unnamed protein product [Pleuronectes platessa]|uniref:Uncharacterized protein n=1 Tax=Pleuronectes platessa TaxID=8262 RepID=A0A9N7TIJ6_PLEPL|nr:unnamed protein product [Pleuronectes platessa]
MMRFLPRVYPSGRQQCRLSKVLVIDCYCTVGWAEAGIEFRVTAEEEEEEEEEEEKEKEVRAKARLHVPPHPQQRRPARYLHHPGAPSSRLRAVTYMSEEPG